MDEVKLLPCEESAIRSLKRLARKWPQSLWLFSASGTLCVMRRDENGQQAHLSSSGVDPAFMVDTISGIPNDGGDW